MVMEVLGANEASMQLQDSVEANSEIQTNSKMKQEPTTEPIKFGLINSTQGLNGDGKLVDKNANSNVPKDAADIWPEHKEVRNFYFVRVRSADDPNLRLKIDQADKETQRRVHARQQIIESLKMKRAERSEVISQLKPLGAEDKHFRAVMDEKKKEREPLQEALGKLRNTNGAGRERGMGLCSSEEELNSLIQQLQYHIQHESNTLAEEKQLLKEIKQLEGTRDKVIANAALRAQIQESLGQKDAIADQVKLIGAGLDEVRKEKQSIRARIKHLEDQLKVINEEISSLEADLTIATEKRDKAFEMLNELRKARDAANVCFYQNRNTLNRAKGLAANKDVATLEEFCQIEVENFMSEWNNKKAFREDYEKRILQSLDSRQLSRDGRIRNPEEKPIASGVPVITKTEQAPPKATIKHVKQEEKAPSEPATIPMKQIVDEDTTPTKVERRGKGGNAAEATDDSFGVEAVQKNTTPQVSEADAAKLMEMKREEEIAKAKQALERKRKLAEKSAAKAAIKAQKEAEKKLREMEKKARKKAGKLASSLPGEQTDADPVIVEPEPEEPEVKKPVPVVDKSKNKDKITYRSRPKVQDKQLHKIITKRKKSQSYWMWAVVPAIILALVLVVTGYYYSTGKISI